MPAQPRSEDWGTWWLAWRPWLARLAWWCCVPEVTGVADPCAAAGPGLGDRLGGGSPSKESSTSSMVVDEGLGLMYGMASAASAAGEDAGDTAAAAMAAAPAGPACTMPNIDHAGGPNQEL